MHKWEAGLNSPVTWSNASWEPYGGKDEALTLVGPIPGSAESSCMSARMTPAAVLKAPARVSTSVLLMPRTVVNAALSLDR